MFQVVKHEWPKRWPTFISDLTGAAKSSEVLCENCMHILKLLSEEVFDFSRGEMTQDKTRYLKSSLNECVRCACLYRFLEKPPALSSADRAWF